MEPSRDDLPARWVCDGLTVLARIYGDEQGPFEAVLATGRSLGGFQTMKAARAAIFHARAIDRGGRMAAHTHATPILRLPRWQIEQKEECAS